MLVTKRKKNLVRVLNPTPSRNFVRVINPKNRRVLNRAKTRSEVEQLFHSFRGRGVKSSTLLEARPGTPKVVAELGGLVELVLDGETIRRRTLKQLGAKISTDERGDKMWMFSPERVKLVADGNGDMHIVGFYLSLPEGFSRGRSYFLGDVVCGTYKADKPHIEDGVQEYEHQFAEHGGEYPRLFYKDGFLLFRGGTYSITPDGIDG